MNHSITSIPFLPSNSPPLAPRLSYVSWTWHRDILAFLTTAAALCLSTSLSAAEFIPLGVLQEKSFSRATGVSDNGLVVAGTSWVDSNATSIFGAEAFRWTDATSIQGLGFLPDHQNSRAGGNNAGYPGISADGSTIVGTSGTTSPDADREPFIHDQGGMTSIASDNGSDGGVAVAASFDGSAVVVNKHNPANGNNLGTFLWREETGLVDLGLVPGNNSHTTASDISDDGTVVVGTSSVNPVFAAMEAGELFRWTPNTGMVGLNVPYGSDASVSSDGAFIASSGVLPGSDSIQAYRWSEETGAVGLGWLSGTMQSDGSQASYARGINGDGSVIVGFSGARSFSSGPEDTTKAFIWTEEQGMQDLAELLTQQYGLSSSLEGWTRLWPSDVSANGQYIVGVGKNPDGNIEGWLARLSAPIPEPSTALLATLGVGLSCLVRKRIA